MALRATKSDGKHELGGTNGEDKANRSVCFSGAVSRGGERGLYRAAVTSSLAISSRTTTASLAFGASSKYVRKHFAAS